MFSRAKATINSVNSDFSGANPEPNKSRNGTSKISTQSIADASKNGQGGAASPLNKYIRGITQCAHF